MNYPSKYLQISTVTVLFYLANYLFPPSAKAGGSIALSDLKPLINQSKKLTQEINRTLKNTNQKTDDIICGGVRLGRHFGPLGATRVAPFECIFGKNQILRIEAINQIKLPNGKLTTAEAVADKFTESNPLTEGSVLRMRLRSWKWEKQ
jgi:hypothetical protein